MPSLRAGQGEQERKGDKVEGTRLQSVSGGSVSCDDVLGDGWGQEREEAGQWKVAMPDTSI